MTTPLCIYHANCADGFGAAWVIRKACAPQEVEFYPGVYQNAPPDVTGREVVMVDFSYKRPVMLELAAKAVSILVIDHHKSAAVELVGLPENVRVVMDMEHSGAMLAWRYCFDDVEPPKLLYHIEDRDLWRFRLPGTREIQAALFSYPYDFKTWDWAMGVDPYYPSEQVLAQLTQEGAAIERKHFKDIGELLGVMTRRMVIGGHDVPIANLPYTLSSDAGHKLAQGEPFAACYYDTPGGRCFSLRSTDTGKDVSEVAKCYGGGGDGRAAGFRVPFTHALGCNVDIAPYMDVEPIVKAFAEKVVGEVVTSVMTSAYTPKVYETYRKPGPTEVIAEG